jgi:hypothetical protein
MYLNYEQEVMNELLEDKIDEVSFYQYGHLKRGHWIKVFFKADTFNMIHGNISHELWNNLLFLNVIFHDELNSGRNFDDFSQKFQMLRNFAAPNKVLSICYNELSRQFEMVKFVKDNAIRTTRQIQIYDKYVLSSLLKFHVSLEMENYEKIMDILKRNEVFNNFQSITSGCAIESEKNEMQLLNEYMIAKLYLKIIFDETKSIEKSLSQIRSLLKTINDGFVLFEVVKTLLALLFVCNKHVKSSSNYKSFHSESTTDITNYGEIFCCSSDNLRKILNFLRSFLNSLDLNEAYKNSNDLKFKFAEVLKIIEKALCKIDFVTDDTSQTIFNKMNFHASEYEWFTFYDEKDNDERTTIEENDDWRSKQMLNFKSMNI